MCSAACRPISARPTSTTSICFGRTFRVYAQADGQFRGQPEDVAGLKTRNARGEMVPLGSVARIGFSTGPDRVSHYNVYLSADINGQAAPGYSSGQATACDGARAERQKLPNGFGYEWTELAFQQKSTAASRLSCLGCACCSCS